MTTEEERVTATRSKTVCTIKRQGFHRRFSSSDPFLVGLKEYVMSLDGGNRPLSTAKAIVSNVSRFLYYHQPEELNHLLLTRKRSIKLFANALKSRTTVSASTLKNTLNSIKDASAYVSDCNLDRRDSHAIVAKYIDHLKGNLNTMHARRKAYNRRRRLTVDASTPDLAEAPQKIKDYAPTVFNLMGHPGLRAEEINVVTSYLVSRLAIENSARSSHITNFSLGEFAEGEMFGTDYVCECKFAKNGHAPLTFSAEMAALTRQYIRDVRPRIPNASSLDTAPLYVNTAGCRLANVSSERRLYKILKLAGVARNFSLTQLRKAITTRASRDLATTPGDLQLVNRYLCHCDEVASEFYTESMRTSEYHRGFRLVQGLLYE